FGAGLVLFHNLRKPGPEDDRLGVNAFTLARGDRGKPIGGKDIVEERGEFRMGGVDGFGALLLENLKLTASPPPLKFRRKTRQEWGKFFHILPNPQCRVFQQLFRRRWALIPCHSRLTLKNVPPDFFVLHPQK